MSTSRTPVYCFSHGGPNLFESTSHPAHRKLQEIGREITTHVKPKAIVVFSAHWQSEQKKIYVNNADATSLIYDFYGFPERYYQKKYPNTGSKALAQKVLDLLQKAGINAEGEKRGLDHGVWVPFLCAFDPEDNPLKVPIVQVSLFDTDDGDQHYRLGQAVSSLRDEGILIIASGMAVHNLREVRMGPQLRPYVPTFDHALRDAMVVPQVTQRQVEMEALLKRSDARRAHPTFEHLLPFFIGAGAGGEEQGKQLFTHHELSLSWAQYRFGEVNA